LWKVERVEERKIMFTQGLSWYWNREQRRKKAGGRCICGEHIRSGRNSGSLSPHLEKGK
jgi:hypothetical protein